MNFCKEILNVKLKKYELDANHIDFTKYYNKLGAFCNEKKDYDEAIVCCEKAWNIRLSLQKKLDLENATQIIDADILDNLGNSYYLKKEYEKALNYHIKAYNIRLKIQQTNIEYTDIETSYINLGVNYKALKEYDKSIDYYVKALEIYTMQPILNHIKIAKNYYNLGNVYYIVRRYDKAILCYKNALNYFDTIIHLVSKSSYIKKCRDNIENCIQQKFFEQKITEEFKKIKVKYQNSDNDLELEFEINDISEKIIVNYCAEFICVENTDISFDVKNCSITLNKNSKEKLRAIIEKQAHDNGNNRNINKIEEPIDVQTQEINLKSANDDAIELVGDANIECNESTG